MKWGRVLSAGLALIAVQIPTTHASAPNFQSMMIALPMTQAWQAYTDTESPSSNLAHSGNTVFQATPYQLQAFNIINGRKLWQIAPNGLNPLPWNPLLKANASTVVIADIKELNAYSTKSGKMIWQSPTAGSANYISIDHTVAAVVSGLNSLTVFDVNTGKVQWSTALPVGITSVEAANNEIAIGTADGTVETFTATGRSIFRTTVKNEGILQLAELSNGNWLATTGNQVTVLSPAGKILWVYTATDTISGGKVAVAGMNVYLATGGETVVKLDAHTGKVLASSQLIDPISLNDWPIYDQGRLYVVAMSIDVLDAATLKVDFNLNHDHSPSNELIPSQEPLAYDGTLLIAGQNNDLSAFR